MSEEQGNIPEEALSFLEQTDKAYGKNSVPKETAPKKSSLGQARAPEEPSSISGANDSPWKNIPIENLPSAGLFYPDGIEITTRAASVAEIRHWSTIDESDMLDVNDKLNFILEKCIRIKTADASIWLSWRDIVEIDRMYLIFTIHEQTFPAKENILWTRFECEKACDGEKRYSTEVRASASLMQHFQMDPEFEKYYRPDYKCFEIESKKMGETFHLYAPTLGNIEKITNRVIADRKKGKQIDKAFVKIAPYLIQDWSQFSDEDFTSMRMQSIGWHQNKFPFINRFAELYQAAKPNSVKMICPKCGSEMKSPLFLGSSFTIKSLFLISGRLDELV